jgi:hypothetical protein
MNQGAAMRRDYEYRGFIVEVVVEADFQLRATQRAVSTPVFIAVVRVVTKGSAVPIVAPLRLGNATGTAFATEADALMNGYAAGQRLVDDLLGKRA